MLRDQRRRSRLIALAILLVTVRSQKNVMPGWNEKLGVKKRY